MNEELAGICKKYFSGDEAKMAKWIKAAIKTFGYDQEGCWREEGDE